MTDHVEPSDAREVDRLVYFSDAVTAIALTLLALDLPVPEGGTEAKLWRSFASAWDDHYFPFLLSFVVIAAFWWTHHELFRRITHMNRRLARLNLLFLLMIVLLPYATRVVGEGGGHQVGVVLYASVVGIIGAALFGIARMVIRRGWLRDPARDEPHVREVSRSLLTTSVVFLVSIPVAFWNPKIAMYAWLVLSLASMLGYRIVAWLRRPAA